MARKAILIPWQPRKPLIKRTEFLSAKIDLMLIEEFEDDDAETVTALHASYAVEVTDFAIYRMMEK